MDLTSATVGQLSIIKTLDAPLSVAAGAGSGKTFTLTNRIGFALLGDRDGGVPPFINSIDEVLAITFSRTGADEMKSRIRSLLRDEGLVDEARKVEDAWISTIHGMCARILREHALELGLDPGFEVVEDVASRELWQRALDVVFARFKEEGDSRYSRLFSWYPEEGGSKDSALSKLLTKVRERTLGLPNGFDSVIIPPRSFIPAAALREVIACSNDFMDASLNWDEEKKGKYVQARIDAVGVALERALSYQKEVDVDQIDLGDPSSGWEEYLDLLLSFPIVTAGNVKYEPFLDAVDRYAANYVAIAWSAVQEMTSVISADLVDLARLVDEEYQRIKGPMCLDNTDLLRVCAKALEANLALRASYQEQFKLIMVDEFQDTDLLQVSIIDSLSTDHGKNVMTVGDAQQGIYRFRGADVEVFYRHRDSQKEAHDAFLAVSLPDNFRSHGDILAFVDHIFSRDDFFGDEFLSLRPSGSVHSEPDMLFESRPRIETHVIEARSHARGGTVQDAHRKAARAIAKSFVELRDKGASPADMAVLLGTLGPVDIYAEALSEAGFESVIAGGSVFASAREVQLVGRLFTCVADKGCSSALCSVLGSDLFNLDDDTLFALAHYDATESGLPNSASLALRFWNLVSIFARKGIEGMQRALDNFALRVESLQELARVLGLMGAFDDSCSLQREPAAALRSLLLDSGWLYRLQDTGAEGMGVAANLFKVIEIVHGFERDRYSTEELARDFAAFLEVSKEQPGVLSTLDTDFVKIMTIHASKGLEFDHVAVSCIRDGKPKSSDLLSDAYIDNVLISLKPKIKRVDTRIKDYPQELDLHFDGDVKPGNLDACEFAAFLDQRIAQGELSAAERLLYVALTRAAKSLCFCVIIDGNKDFHYDERTFYGSLAEALAWPLTDERSITKLEYGGSAPALITHEVLVERAGEITEEHVKEDQFALIEQEPIRLVEVQVEGDRHDVVSYSSLASHQHTLSFADDIDEVVESGATGKGGDEVEEMFVEDIAAQVKQHHAVALGTAFHLLAQQAIESRTEVGVVPCLGPEALLAKARFCGLDAAQIDRLREAGARWFASDLCQRFFTAPSIRAEVPFMIELVRSSKEGSQRIFLEGEIDGLATYMSGFDEETHAFFVDYKTGGNEEESDEELYEKHLLQAQCYSLALLRQGFASVEANFIRVERDDSRDQTQPQVVVYRFVANEIPILERALWAAYDARDDAAS